MILSVQLAARRLGVSPHTIRRWTASGFLPCTRTAGGHRRIKQEDIDELASLIGDSNHLAARLARERELETLVSTAVALSAQLDLSELLAEIAKRMTSLLDCHFCAISDYDEETRTVRVLADFDHSGTPLARLEPLLDQRVPAHQAGAHRAGSRGSSTSTTRAPTPPRSAIMRRNGDKSLLLLPLIYQGRTVGLLEVLDHVRERRFSRQELRLARALWRPRRPSRSRTPRSSAVCGAPTDDVQHLQSALARAVGHRARRSRREPAPTRCSRGPPTAPAGLSAPSRPSPSAVRLHGRCQRPAGRRPRRAPARGRVRALTSSSLRPRRGPTS